MLKFEILDNGFITTRCPYGENCSVGSLACQKCESNIKYDSDNKEIQCVNEE